MPTQTQQLDGTFVADPVHSTFQFSVNHMKVSSFRATFGDVRAQMVAGDGSVSLEGRARVDSISIRNPLEFREHVVNGGDFFDAANHPEIAFRSAAVELADDDTVSLDGELELRGVTRPLQATGTIAPPVEDPFGNTRTALELTATVDRREWGMDWQMPLPKGGEALGWDVQLTVHLELIRQA